MDVKLAVKMAQDAYDRAKAEKGEFDVFRVYRNDLTGEAVGSLRAAELRSIFARALP